MEKETFRISTWSKIVCDKTNNNIVANRKTLYKWYYLSTLALNQKYIQCPEIKPGQSLAKLYMRQLVVKKVKRKKFKRLVD